MGTQGAGQSEIDYSVQMDHLFLPQLGTDFNLCQSRYRPNQSQSQYLRRALGAVLARLSSKFNSEYRLRNGRGTGPV